ncbi:MAG TPA: preprotein translocase subunit YajC [Jatrophihabitans sp.]|nr:preprotein translocase subunit YajC [Jatrophihabitans sp.]
MRQLIPIIILALLLFALMTWTRRNRQRTARADQQRREALGPGSPVMTTSGLYGTVVSVDTTDDSVRLAIAPGVEVKWTIAALRSVTELPPKYRDAIDGQGSGGD